ncbi:unnamed protein product [Linum trigynum]|uniref:CCHC-type domain-containing protein n=1 Tax=Linum trigynum TaxID=586398 RepID=A0AAV2FVZ4_9ROSI
MGRLFTTDQFTMVELRDALRLAWQIKGLLKVSKAKFDLFEITMPNEEAKKWALNRNPWVIKDKLFALRSWTPSITKDIFDEMTVAPFRVQLWGVNEVCFTKSFGLKFVASAIGQVLESGVYACKESGELFIKVQTIINFAKPLRSQLMEVSEEVDSFWVSLKYELLPSFCYHCGRVGHPRQDCTFDPPLGKERFGPHMTTKKFGRQIFEEDDEAPTFRGTRNSVWVNRQSRGMMDETVVADAGTGTRGRAQQQVPNSKGKKEVFLTTGQGFLDKSMTRPNAKFGMVRSPKRGPSPRGFALHKSPKLKLGGGRRKLLDSNLVGEPLVPHEQEMAEPLPALYPSRSAVVL